MNLCVVFNQTQAGAAAAPEDDPDLPTVKDVCVAYCSVAEIYLSDLWYGSEGCIIQSDFLFLPSAETCACFVLALLLFACSMEEGAADKCREFIERALQHQSDNPEALQLMASYLFSTEKNQVNTHTLKMSYPILKKEFAELIFSEKIELNVINHNMDIHYTLMLTDEERNDNYSPDH